MRLVARRDDGCQETACERIIQIMRFSDYSFGPREIPDAPGPVPDQGAEARIRRREAREAEEAEEKAKAEAREKAKAEHEAKMELAKEKLADVRHDREEELRKAARRCDNAVEDIKSRQGDDRSQSFEEINQQIKALKSLKRDSEEKAQKASGELLQLECRDWTRAHAAEADARLKELRWLKDDLERDERLEQDHIERAGIDDGVKGRDRSIVTKTIRFAAQVAFNHLVPGYGSLIVDAGEVLLRLTGVLGDPDSIDGVEIGVPLTVGNGLFNINVGVKFDDSSSQPVTLSIGPDIGYNFPSIDVVEENPDRLRGQHPQQAEQPEVPEATQSRETAAVNEAPDPAKDTTGPESAESEQPDVQPSALASVRPEPEQELAESEQPDVLPWMQTLVRPEPEPEAEANDVSADSVAPDKSGADAAQPDKSGPDPDEGPLGLRPDSGEARRPLDHDAHPPTHLDHLASNNLGDLSLHQSLLTPEPGSAPQALPPPPAEPAQDVQQPGDSSPSTVTAQGEEGPGAQAPATAQQPKRATAVVICGSVQVLAAAAGTRDLDSNLIVSIARQALVRKHLHGTIALVAAAVRAARDLEVVVFWDPEFCVGLWIDVNPVSQQAAATLLITMTVAGDRLNVRCYRS